MKAGWCGVFLVGTVWLSSTVWAGALDATLEIDSDAAGASPAHRVRVPGEAGSLQLFEAYIAYPDAFSRNGFLALGPPGTVVGSYDIDFDGDGTPELVRPLLSLDDDSAWLDVFDDGTFSPGIEPRLVVFENELHLRIPLGGDGDGTTHETSYAATLTFTLAAGLLVNPLEVGAYVVEARLVSVDPDTGGPDDLEGTPPEIESLELTLDVTGSVGPGDVPFSTLDIAHARIHVHPDRPGAQIDWFWILGRFALGAASDGLALDDEAVSVTFGPFEQTIPAGSLHPQTRRSWRRKRSGRDAYGYRVAGAAGIRQIVLWSDGAFLVAVRGADLGDLDVSEPIPFVLRIGDDEGEALLKFDRKGRYRP